MGEIISNWKEHKPKRPFIRFDTLDQAKKLVDEFYSRFETSGLRLIIDSKGSRHHGRRAVLIVDGDTGKENSEVTDWLREKGVIRHE